MENINIILKMAAVVILCCSMIFFGCKKKEEPTQEVIFEPIASFTTDVKYVTNSDQTVTAQITFNNYSSYSNRWLWKFENQGEISTDNIDLLIVKEYAATSTGRTYEFKLTAYSDVNVGLDEDGEIIYETFENTQTQYVTIRKPTR